jgi:putative hydrolase of the HAD superfamily
MGRIRAVFLDVGWTLAYPRDSIWDIFAQLCTAAGVPTAPASCEQLIRTLSRAGQERAEAEFHAGARYSDSDEEFAGLFAQMGRVILSHVGIADRQDELTQRFLQIFWNEGNWGTFPEVLPVLAAMRARGIALGVLSNAPSNLPAFLGRLGIAAHLDFSVVSASVRVKKPDRRIFETALRRAGVDASEALHVGDMYLEDIVGGRAAGLNTLLIERGRHALFPNYRESEGRRIDPGAIVSDLTQILDRLD